MLSLSLYSDGHFYVLSKVLLFCKEGVAHIQLRTRHNSMIHTLKNVLSRYQIKNIKINYIYIRNDILLQNLAKYINYKPTLIHDCPILHS